MSRLRPLSLSLLAALVALVAIPAIAVGPAAARRSATVPPAASPPTPLRALADYGWNRAPAFTTHDLTSVGFVDELNGWIGARGYDIAQTGLVFHTTDGGTTWQPQTTGDGYQIVGVAAVTPQVAVVLSRPYGPSPDHPVVVKRTTDAGATWTPVAIPPRSEPARIVAVDASHLWIAGRRWGEASYTWSGQILASTDGGATWKEQLLATGKRVNDLGFTDHLAGWAVGDQCGIWRTTNGGESWAVHELGLAPGEIDPDPPWEPSFTGISVLDESHVNVTAATFWDPGMVRSHIVRTSDGGTTWAATEVGTLGVSRMTFLSSDVGWTWVTVPETPLLSRAAQTVDGGATLAPQADTLMFGTPRALAFTPHGGWMVGDSGAVFSLGPHVSSPDTEPPSTVSDADHLWSNHPVVVSLTATDPGSGVVQTLYRLGTGAWKVGSTIEVPAPGVLWDGVNTIQYRSIDGAGNLEAKRYCSVTIDTHGATTWGARRVVVRRGRKPVFFAGASDELSMKADFTIVIRTSRGRVVKRLPLGRHPVGVELRVKADCWRCRLAKGRYVYRIHATDLAGNREVTAASAPFVVR